VQFAISNNGYAAGNTNYHPRSKSNADRYTITNYCHSNTGAAANATYG